MVTDLVGTASIALSMGSLCREKDRGRRFLLVLGLLDQYRWIAELERARRQPQFPC